MRHAARENLALDHTDEATADERTTVPAGAAPSEPGTLPARRRSRRRGAPARSEERSGPSAVGLASHGLARDSAGQNLVRTRAHSRADAAPSAARARAHRARGRRAHGVL